ncbi:MAG: rubrerythrin family protein [Clostridia bacterium]|nr:rubrerythrin family protein [Clostridia bacterium]
MKLLESKTLHNLARSFAGETQASTRYKFIEYGARNEGYNALAEIIDKIAFNEFNHGRMFYTYIQQASPKMIENIDISAGYPFKEKWNLVENLKLAADDEEHDRNLYKEFEKVAREEGFQEIANLFAMTASVEECHKKLFLDLYQQFSSGTAYKKDKTVKWKCSGCGYEAESKEAWDKCPLCDAKQGFVMLQVASK